MSERCCLLDLLVDTFPDGLVRLLGNTLEAFKLGLERLQVLHVLVHLPNLGYYTVIELLRDGLERLVHELLNLTFDAVLQLVDLVCHGLLDVREFFGPALAEGVHIVRNRLQADFVPILHLPYQVFRLKLHIILDLEQGLLYVGAESLHHAFGLTLLDDEVLLHVLRQALRV